MDVVEPAIKVCINSGLPQAIDSVLRKKNILTEISNTYSRRTVT